MKVNEGSIGRPVQETGPWFSRSLANRGYIIWSGRVALMPALSLLRKPKSKPSSSIRSPSPSHGHTAPSFLTTSITAAALNKRNPAAPMRPSHKQAGARRPAVSDTSSRLSDRTRPPPPPPPPALPPRSAVVWGRRAGGARRLSTWCHLQRAMPGRRLWSCLGLRPHAALSSLYPPDELTSGVIEATSGNDDNARKQQTTLGQTLPYPLSNHMGCGGYISSSFAVHLLSPYLRLGLRFILMCTRSNRKEEVL
ncbi:hypothetical protein BDV95DRAFT_334317 [Massariosphaeria phaeospora]|uniref:Uncharacterized protein n=1 Tax=Massariosphaeria phaeospora TaxID=100035 RepID=A0A7C8IES9_9PLEO|nr:hypothetical protein BDV95DRAFT_334317 [Massariosphaeria phaeospora]